MNDHEQACAWAQLMLSKPDVLILDSETTGLRGSDQVCQLAILTTAGQVILDTLVKPTIPISRDASAIHGITDATVAEAPTFAELAPKLREILAGATVLIYNANFDTRLLEQSARAHQLTTEEPIFAADYRCAMEVYSQWVGEWSRFGDYKWQRLPGGDHTALGDCKATLDVLKRMAGPLAPVEGQGDAVTGEAQPDGV